MDVKGFEPSKCRRPPHYQRLPPCLGKRASLLGPLWLFQCIRNPRAEDTWTHRILLRPRYRFLRLPAPYQAGTPS